MSNNTGGGTSILGLLGVVFVTLKLIAYKLLLGIAWTLGVSAMFLVYLSCRLQGMSSDKIIERIDKMSEAIDKAI